MSLHFARNILSAKASELALIKGRLRYTQSENIYIPKRENVKEVLIGSPVENVWSERKSLLIMRSRWHPVAVQNIPIFVCTT